MQLNRMSCAALLCVLGAWPSMGQSLSPMRAQGPTPSDIKGFRVEVGNPYRQPMVFDIIPMDPAFRRRAADAVARPSRVVLAPNTTRSVILAFKIDSTTKERTIGLCVIPANLAGSILPRVCGTYMGSMLAGAGG